MKRGICAALLAACLLSLTACGVEKQPETTAAETVETTAATEITEPIVETIPETTVEEIPQWDYTAEEVTGSIRISLDGRGLTERLTDNNRDTRKLIDHAATLKIESDKPFSALYLEWDAMPHPYLIQWDEGEQLCGTEEFQHDYVRLPEAVASVTFVMPDYLEPVLCEVRAFTEGAAPEGVQDWRDPCRVADVLVFPTHSDDDALFFGALMSYYAVEMGLNIQTAFMTKHYSEPERCHERLDGLWEVGIRNYPILADAPDLYAETLEEARYLYAQYDVLGWQIQQIRRFQPKVIVAHDLNGEYGHGGHMLNAHTLKEAVELAADENAYPDTAQSYGVWDTPKLYFHLYPENKIAVDVNTRLENDPRGRTPFEIAVDAYGHHKSQHWCYFEVSQDDPEENCVWFGLYRSLVGEDTVGDIMDNIGYG